MMKKIEKRKREELMKKCFVTDINHIYSQLSRIDEDLAEVVYNARLVDPRLMSASLAARDALTTLNHARQTYLPEYIHFLNLSGIPTKK